MHAISSTWMTWEFLKPWVLIVIAVLGGMLIAGFLGG